MLSESSNEPMRSRAQAWLGLCLANPKDKTRALRWPLQPSLGIGPELMKGRLPNPTVECNPVMRLTKGVKADKPRRKIQWRVFDWKGSGI